LLSLISMTGGLASGAASDESAAGLLNVVAVSENTAFGGPNQYPELPRTNALNDRGDITFVIRHKYSFDQGDEAYSTWLWRAGHLSQISPEPFIDENSGREFRNFVDPILGANGRVAFRGVVGSYAPDRIDRLYVADANSRVELARTGQVIGNARLSYLDPVSVLDNGDVVVLATIQSTVSGLYEQAFYRAGQTGLQRILGPGDLLPGAAQPIRNRFFINPEFIGRHDDTLAFGVDARSLVAIRGDAPVLLNKPGDAVNGGGFVIERVLDHRLPAINENGDYAFEGVILAPGSQLANALLANFGDGPTVVAVLDGQAPGVTFDVIRGTILNSDGVLALGANDSGRPQGIWTTESGSLREVVSSGQTAPFLADGTTFAHVGLGGFNDRNQLLFFATTEGSETTSGYWTRHPEFGVFPVLLQGQEIELFPDEFYTITQIHNADLNNAGTVAIQVELFKDETTDFRTAIITHHSAHSRARDMGDGGCPLCRRSRDPPPLPRAGS
jgi:hypothetical protein